MTHLRRTRVVVAAAGLGLVAAGALLSSRGARNAPLVEATAPPTARRVAPTGAAAPRGVTRPTAGVARAGESPAPAAMPGADVHLRPIVGRQILFPAGSAPREGDLGGLARRLLDDHREALGLDRVPGELRVVREFTTLSGHHLRLGQVVGGVPVEGSEIASHVARDGRPLLLSADAFAVEGVPTAPRISADEAVAVVRELLVDPVESAEDAAAASFEHKVPELWIRPEGNGGRLVWRVDARTDAESARVSVDALDGDVVDVRDLRHALEVTGRARVFQPNPVLSTRDATLRDRRDASSAALEAAMVTVDVQRLDGSGRVRGKWCDAARGRGDSVNSKLDWTALTRDDDAFEIVNAYYHVDRTQEALQALGLTGANAQAQRVSAHHLAADQSYYEDYDDEIRFGDGGVDDAEDGDIVVHEYGHAIQADLVRDFPATAEGQAVGEGFSDFLCCAMHATGDPAWDPLFASWDATIFSFTGLPYLRRVDRDKVYPRDYVKEPHDDGEIWSRFLWDLRALVGHDDALRLVIEAHAYMNSNSGFKVCANSILVANVALRSGGDDESIRVLLRNRGLPFSFPPLNAPPEDAYEPNDFLSSAATLPPGSYADLLLADDDWYRVTLLPFRRLRAQADFYATETDLDLEARTESGALVAQSVGTSASEEVVATAGSDGATFLVHAYRKQGVEAVAGYRLVLQDLDIETARAGRTVVRRVASGASDALTLPVATDRAAGGWRIVVTSSALRRGAVNDVRVVSPSGGVAAELGAGRGKLGARVVVPLTEAGNWRIELRPRNGSSGRYAFQAKLTRLRKR